MSHHHSSGFNIVPIVIIGAFIVLPFIARALFGGSKNAARVANANDAGAATPHRSSFSEFTKMARQLEAVAGDPDAVKELLEGGLGGVAAMAVRTLGDARSATVSDEAKATSSSDESIDLGSLVSAFTATAATTTIASLNAAAVAKAQQSAKRRAKASAPDSAPPERRKRHGLGEILDPTPPLPTLSALAALAPLPVGNVRAPYPPIAV